MVLKVVHVRQEVCAGGTKEGAEREQSIPAAPAAVRMIPALQVLWIPAI